MSLGHRASGRSEACGVCGAVLDRGRLDGLCPACTWSAVVAPEAPAPGTLAAGSEPWWLALPGHEVIEEIARGGMGVVYRARQLNPQRIVALKMLLPHQTVVAEMRERFRIETRAIAALDHPGILPVYQVGEHEGLPYFTMKYASGGTLAARREAYRGRFRAIAELIATLADALHFAHERGVLHRDLKPGNILFDEAGRPYLSDFGLAKFIDLDHRLTRTAHFLGTPHYLAPEVAARCARFATLASDVYSLGAILYELLAGRPPFEAEGVPALLKKIAEEEPAPIRAPDGWPATRGTDRLPGCRSRTASPVPRDLQVICLRCLAKEPGQRYASARALAADLRRWLQGQPIRAQPCSPFKRLQKWARRNPAIAALATLLLLALLGSAATLAAWNQRLQQALGSSHASLQESLLVQARLERKRGRIGQRAQALALVDRAVALARSSQRPDPAHRLAARREAAGALALTDLRPIERWPVPLRTWDSAVAFTDDLAHYATPSPEGGFVVRATAGRRLVRHFPGAVSNPAVQFKFSRGALAAPEQPALRARSGPSGAEGQWVAALFQDGGVEVHSLEAHSTPRRYPGHPAARTDVEFVPGTARLLVAEHQGGLAWHDLADGTRREILAPPATVTGLRVDARGQRLACFAEGRVQILRLADGARLWSVPLAHGTAQLAWSSDTRHLAIAESAQPFEITVVELGSAPSSDAGSAGSSGSVPFSSPGPHGSFNLVTPLAKPASNMLSARVVTHFQDHELSASRLSFHPDGRALVSVGWDNRLVWRQLVQGGQRLLGHAGWRVLEFSSDGRRLACEPSYGQVALLEVVPSAVFHEWHRLTPPDEQAARLAVSPDGRLVATSSVRGIQFWDAASRSQIAQLALPNRATPLEICFHPNGRALLYSGLGLGILQVDIGRRDAEPSGKQAIELGAARPLGTGPNLLLQHVAPDRRSLIVAEACEPLGAASRVWLWPDGQPARARLLADGFPLVRYGMTPDGRWGVTSHLTEPDVWVWDPQTGRRVTNLGVPHAADSRISPDGRWLLVTTGEQHQLWETGTWRPGPAWTHSLQHGDWASAFSADGRWVATATAEGQVEIRSLPQAEVILSLPPPQPLHFHDLAFSPDHRRLYLWQSAGRLLEWDLGELRRELAERGLDWPE